MHKFPSMRRQTEPKSNFEGKIIKPQKIGATNEEEKESRLRQFVEKRTSYSFDTPQVTNNLTQEKEKKRQ